MPSLDRSVGEMVPLAIILAVFLNHRKHLFQADFRVPVSRFLHIALTQILTALIRNALYDVVVSKFRSGLEVTFFIMEFA